MKKARPVPASPATLDDAIDQAIAHAQALVELLVRHSPGYSVKDRNRRLKLPSTSTGAIAPLLHIAKKHGLAPHAAPIEEHTATLAKLIELRVRVTRANTLSADLEMQSETATWQATTLVYTMLRRLARSDGDLTAQLAPIVEKYFTRKKQAAAAADAGSAQAPVGAQAPSVAKKAKKRRRRR